MNATPFNRYCSPEPGASAKMAFAAMGLLVAGTGSVFPVEHADSWWSLVQPRVSFSLSKDRKQAPTPAEIDIRDIASHVANIRAVLNPSMADLAMTFGVSRQAIYKWLSRDSEPEAATLQVVKILSEIADTFEKAGVVRAGSLVKMKAFDGRSLLDLVGSKGATSEHVKMLIDEASRIERNTLISGVNSSKAKPTSDWRASLSIAGSAEST